MKKLLLSTIISGLAATSMAAEAPMNQSVLNAGDIVIGADFSNLNLYSRTFSNDGEKTGGNFNFGFGVDGAYFVTANIGVGAEVSYYSNSWSDKDGKTYYKYSNYGLTPKISYRHDINEKLIAKSWLGYTLYNSSTSSDSDGDREFSTNEKSEYSENAFQAGAEAQYLLTEHFSIDGGARYSYHNTNTQEDDSKTTAGVFNIKAGASLHF